MQYRTSVDVDNLFSTSVIPVLTDYMTIATGQTLKRGALIDETGTLCKATTEVFAVLADDIDTTDGVKQAADALRVRELFAQIQSRRSPDLERSHHRIERCEQLLSEAYELAGEGEALLNDRDARLKALAPEK